MSHIAFIAPPFLGHLNPMRAMARELVRRGHRATFVHMADVEPLVGADERIGFHAVGRSTHPPGRLARMTSRMTRVDGVFGIGRIIRDVVDSTEMLGRELPGALRSIDADLVVCDGAEAAGGLVAEHLGLPFVTVANALPLNREPAVPPPFLGWRYDPSHWGTERNGGGYRVSDILMRRHARVIGGYAERWRLGERRTIADCLSPLAQISQTVAGFDFPRVALPEVFHHVGPLRDPAFGARGPGGVKASRPGSRPLAYGSLGTLQGGRAALFRRIAAAAERLDLRLVLAHGGRLSAEAAASLPGAPEIHAFVRQDEVLAEAAVAIVNGGLNTVMDALAHGVPLIVIPIAFEQAAIAARVEHAGAGLSVGRRLLTAARLAGAIETVIQDPARLAAAGRLATEIAAAGGVIHAVDIVESVLASGQPVTREAAESLRTRRARADAASRPSERAA